MPKPSLRLVLPLLAGLCPALAYSSGKPPKVISQFDWVSVGCSEKASHDWHRLRVEEAAAEYCQSVPARISDWAFERGTSHPNGVDLFGCTISAEFACEPAREQLGFSVSRQKLLGYWGWIAHPLSQGHPRPEGAEGVGRIELKSQPAGFNATVDVDIMYDSIHRSATEACKHRYFTEARLASGLEWKIAVVELSPDDVTQDVILQARFECR
jgi:hypothetical protein